jgi:hypothetical protein
MIARIAEIEHVPADADPAYADRVRAHLAALDGFCGGYHLIDRHTGRATSITLWRDAEAMTAAGRSLAGPQGPADGRITRQGTAQVQVADVVAAF